MIAALSNLVRPHLMLPLSNNKNEHLSSLVTRRRDCPRLHRFEKEQEHNYMGYSGPLLPLSLPILLMLPRLCLRCGHPLSKWDGEKETNCPHCGESINMPELVEDGSPDAELPEELPKQTIPEVADVKDIEDALNSADETEIAWAKDEISRLPPEVAVALRRKHSLP